MKISLKPRNRELIIIASRISREAAAAGQVLTLEELAAKVRECRPLHFYCDYDHACRMMSLIERTGADNMADDTDIRAGWLDLYRQVQEMKRMRPKLNANQALVQTMMYRRPSRVYLSINTIRKILAPHFRALLTATPDNRA